MRTRILPIYPCKTGLAFLFMASSLTFSAQPPASPQASAQQPAAATAGQTSQARAHEASLITADDLKQRLVGKTLYLRGGYLDNSLHFDQNGQFTGNSPQVSYTLSLVEIEKVSLAKHRVELEGVRYGLHFLGGLPSQDPTQAADKVRLTPKKKMVKITIDREEVVSPKKQKAAKYGKGKGGLPPPASLPRQGTGDDQAPLVTAIDRHGFPVTTSAAHANKTLYAALEKVFASGIDDQMIAALPDYWKSYYLVAATKTSDWPSDPSVFRQNAVDQKAKLQLSFEPASNEYAQTNGVAGLALYHVVVSAEGKPTDIAVGRPIGFGLDENAVASIRKASFQPALKDGKPVPVVLDLLVQFRIYSKRTGVVANTATRVEGDKGDAPSLPGPYSVKQP